MKSNILNVMLLMPFRNIIIISMSEFSMLKNLEQLQADGCQTDIFLVGATSKVSIHRAMLFAGHVKPDLVWYQLDPGEEDGKVIVIVPDASTEELKSFVRKLYSPLLSGPSRRQNLMVADEMFPDRPGAGIHFADIEDVVRDVGGPANLLNDLTASDCPGEDIFYTAVPNTPDKTVPATPNIFHTASQSGKIHTFYFFFLKASLRKRNSTLRDNWRTVIFLQKI